jgi:hypothetical protein
MNILLRLTIIVISGFAIWQFSEACSLAMETLAKPREARWSTSSPAGRRRAGAGACDRGDRARRRQQAPGARSDYRRPSTRHLRHANSRLYHRRRDLWLLSNARVRCLH